MRFFLNLAKCCGLLALAILLGQQTVLSDDQIFKSKEHDYKAVTLVKGLDKPWGMAFLPREEGILITEKSGNIRHYKPGFQLGLIKGGPNSVEFGQGGLLDIVLHPEFKRNQLTYFTYVARSGTGFGTELARARFNGHRFDDLRVLFKASPKAFSGRHFGSRLIFDPKGYLFMTYGDRGSRREAQNLRRHEGSIFRFTADGGVPRDNPFIGKSEAQPEIFSYGHRNVQGAALNPKTGVLWVHEHGPQGGDEVNILKYGANYGWPVITYGEEYGGGSISNFTHKEGMEQPVLYWVPSIAPSGMTFYDGERFPRWKGDLFVGALRGAHLRRISFKEDLVLGQEQLLVELEERIRDVREGPDGYIYILTDSSNASLIRLEPVPR